MLKKLIVVCENMLQKPNLGVTPAEKYLSLNSELHVREELVHAHHQHFLFMACALRIHVRVMSIKVMVYEVAHYQSLKL